MVLCKFPLDSGCEKSLNIGQYLMKLYGVQKGVPIFWATLYILAN